MKRRRRSRTRSGTGSDSPLTPDGSNDRSITARGFGPASSANERGRQLRAALFVPSVLAALTLKHEDGAALARVEHLEDQARLGTATAPGNFIGLIADDLVRADKVHRVMLRMAHQYGCWNLVPQNCRNSEHFVAEK